MGPIKNNNVQIEFATGIDKDRLYLLYPDFNNFSEESKKTIVRIVLHYEKFKEKEVISK